MEKGIKRGKSQLVLKQGTDSNMPFAEVAVSLNLHNLLTYHTGTFEVNIGDVVLVEVVGRKVKGVVINLKSNYAGDYDVKPILEVFPYKISHFHIKLMKWMHDYYLGGWDSIVRLFLPPGEIRRESLKIRLKSDVDNLPDNEIIRFLLSKGKKWTALSTLRKRFGENFRKVIGDLMERELIQVKEVKKSIGEKAMFSDEIEGISIPSEPTEEQYNALKKISPFIEKGKYRTFLIHGVTGSGKTALYLWLTSHAVKSGKGVYILVPEIALSHQISAYFQRVFGPKVGIYHSNLTPGERRWLWNRAYYGDIKIVVGPRSSLFIPLKNPGLIVVDEEHDTSYKEERAPFYNARDVAVMMGKILDIPVILGSATPSVESYYNAQVGKYDLIRLKKRIRGYFMPKIEVVDMREEKSDSVLSIKMLEELRSTVTSNKQAILFLNRRGFSHHIQCADCGYIEKCPHCSVSLVYHKSTRTLECHLCGFRKRVPEVCPKCGSYRLRPVGFGTEKVEEELSKFFPKEIIVRMDLDTTRKRGAHREIYKEFLSGKKKIMIGTQMVTKGFDFPGVGFVGVLLADTTLGIPDFRAEEFTFQLINQVAGRSRKGGKVIIQTYNPDDIAIKSGSSSRYEEFFEKELNNRKLFGYPPFVRLGYIEVRSRTRSKASKEILKVVEVLLSHTDEDVEIIGPAPAPIEKLMGYYRYRVLLKASKPYAIQHLLKETGMVGRAGKRFVINIDPTSLL